MNDMGEKEKENPGYINPELCEAYRAVLDEKITGIRNQILTGLAISTAIISIIVAAINYL